MRSRTAANSRARIAVLVALSVTLLGTGQAVAAARPTAALPTAAADDSASMDISGTVGLGAVALGVVGLLLGLVRQQRRRAAATSNGAPDPNARLAPQGASTVPGVRPVTASAPAPSPAPTPASAPAAPTRPVRAAAQPPVAGRGAPAARPTALMAAETTVLAPASDRDWFAPAKPVARQHVTQGAGHQQDGPQPARTAHRPQPVRRTHPADSR